METQLIGIGNAGRQDDGLGWAFAAACEDEGVLPGSIHYRYQLQVEDAELISAAERVVFVDAFRGDLPGGFSFRRCEPAPALQFTTHALAPESVLFLCRELYGRMPEAHCLLIAGEAFEIQTGLSEPAARNLHGALRYFRTVLDAQR